MNELDDYVATLVQDDLPMLKRRKAEEQSNFFPRFSPSLSGRNFVLTLDLNPNSNLNIVHLFRDYLHIIGIWQTSLDYLKKYLSNPEKIV